jgi:hypothetical protein
MASSNTLPIDFRAEEAELYEICNRAAAAVYKFFCMFQVEIEEGATNGVVKFGKSYEDDEVPVAIAKQIKAYVREQKKEIKGNPKGYTAEEGRRKVFWLISMLLEHGIFCPSHQTKIMTYGSFVFHETKDDEY